MIRVFCQVVVAGLFLLGFFATLYWDIEGRPEVEPKGFAGVLSTFAIYAAFVALYWGAGVLELFFK